MGKSKIITYVVVALLIAAGLYWAYGMISQPAENSVVGVVATGDTAIGGSDQTGQFVEILSDIDAIDLQNRLILSNKLFTSLKDFGRAIQDRAIGRNNPFSPFTGGAGNGVTINKTVTNSAVGGNDGTGSTTDPGADGDARLDVLGE